MLTLRGKYSEGTITLFGDETQLPESSEVLVTVMGETPEADDEAVEIQVDEHSEDHYKSIRQFKRVKAKGNITIIDKDGRNVFRLNDYSQGGLSFIAPKAYPTKMEISAGISDPSNPEMILMELEMEVRGVFNADQENHFKIGCKFSNSLDEELWHGLLQHLS